MYISDILISWYVKSIIKLIFYGLLFEKCYSLLFLYFSTCVFITHALILNIHIILEKINVRE
jgi:hypothetical protein